MKQRSVSPSYLEGTLGLLGPFFTDVMNVLTRNDLSKKGFILALSSRVRPVVMGKARCQEAETASPITSEVGAQGERNAGAVPFYSAWNPGLGTLLLSMRMGLATFSFCS